MIPASYLFKSLYQSRFERTPPAAEVPDVETPQGGSRDQRGARHPAVPFLAILAGFGLGR
ncbi:hypothetical protein [Kaistia granuli]|uniref:hypothetical protein n=1 Tax=Kaistia granuli TaxID=363259 RepID=UPI0003624C95|nr:hypothetical protein [Kaistia granuli]